MTSSASACLSPRDRRPAQHRGPLGPVLFHLGGPRILQRFVRVDVFFVISRFLIGSLLWREYAARARSRSALLSCGSRRLAHLLRHGGGVRGVGYLGAAAVRLESSAALITWTVSLSNSRLHAVRLLRRQTNETVLLHTWSLSIKEHFYILFPSLSCSSMAASPVGRCSPPRLMSLVACVHATRVSSPRSTSSLAALGAPRRVPARRPRGAERRALAARTALSWAELAPPRGRGDARRAGRGLPPLPSGDSQCFGR